MCVSVCLSVCLWVRVCVCVSSTPSSLCLSLAPPPPSPSLSPPPHSLSLTTDMMHVHAASRTLARQLTNKPYIWTILPQLDDDGGGSIDRKEMVLGLFALGVWLHPSESNALMVGLGFRV
jgi:hypothetical protein